MSKKRIRYKIVNQDRKSIFTNKMPEYVLEYLKGTEVKKIDGTIGVFCFITKDQAKSFMISANTSYFKSYSIIKVLAKGREIVPKKICAKIIQTYFDEFYDSEKKLWYDIPPRGTICYPSVLVLE